MVIATVGPPPAQACPQIWNNTTIPAGVASDATAVELGVKFQASVNGYITALRFYKFPNNPGPHIGDLWSGSGGHLATVPFTNETASGWQQVAVSPPVPITAGITYIAAYHTNVGYYAANESYFVTGVTNGPLRALADSEGGNGVYRYSSSVAFPDQTYQASNYWVDAVFVTSVPDTTPPALSGWGPAGTGVPLSANVAVTVTEHMDPATINTSTFELRDASGALVPSTVTYNDLTYTATLDPLGALSYLKTYTVVVHGGSSGPRIMDLAGNAMPRTPVEFHNAVALIRPVGPGGPISSSPHRVLAATTPVLRAEG